MECLLSYIEFVQFQNYLSYHVDANDDILTKTKSLRLSSRIPLSAIVQETEKIPKGYTGDKFLFFAKMKAHKLYEKYIKVGCEFEINISSKARCKLHSKLGNIDSLINEQDTENPMTIRDLILVFEHSKIEMLKLLTYSLTRMKGGCGLSTQILSLRTNSRTRIHTDDENV